MLDFKIIKQQVAKSYPKIRDYYSPDIEGYPEIDYSWPNVYARYSKNVDMEGEDEASAEFVRKENKYTDIKSLNILKRAKYCQRLYNKGYSVKDIAEKYNLSESRIRQYLKK